MREVVLPSGAKLGITMAPFAESKALYMALLEEIKGLKMDPDVELDTNFLKDLVCTGFSSKKVDAALGACLKRVTYNGLKIDDGTFEPEDSRQDYPVVLFEVAQDNIKPFTKSLFARYADMFQRIQKGQL